MLEFFFSRCHRKTWSRVAALVAFIFISWQNTLWKKNKSYCKHSLSASFSTLIKAFTEALIALCHFIYMNFKVKGLVRHRLIKQLTLYSWICNLWGLCLMPSVRIFQAKTRRKLFKHHCVCFFLNWSLKAPTPPPSPISPHLFIHQPITAARTWGRTLLGLLFTGVCRASPG